MFSLIKLNTACKCDASVNHNLYIFYIYISVPQLNFKKVHWSLSEPTLVREHLSELEEQWCAWLSRLRFQLVGCILTWGLNYFQLTWKGELGQVESLPLGVNYGDHIDLHTKSNTLAPRHRQGEDYLPFPPHSTDPLVVPKYYIVCCKNLFSRVYFSIDTAFLFFCIFFLLSLYCVINV